MSTIISKHTEKNKYNSLPNENCNNSDLFILALSKNLSYDELMEIRKDNNT